MIKVAVIKLVVRASATIKFNGGTMQWLEGPVAVVIRALARRVIPVLLGALIGLLADAGLLDGALVRDLGALLN